MQEVRPIMTDEELEEYIEKLRRKMKENGYVENNYKISYIATVLEVERTYAFTGEQLGNIFKLVRE